MSETKSNAERFLDAYARVERELTAMLKQEKYIPFAQMLSRCSGMNFVVSRNRESLREYNELRNAIVHLRSGKDEIIAEPTDAVTEDIERIADLLSRDETILSCASSPVKVVSPRDTIRGAYAVMRHLNSSKIPVYRKNRFYGVLTIEDVCKWAIEGADDSLRVQDIMQEVKKNKVAFLRKDALVIDVTRGFEHALNQGSSMLAVLITENGSPDEEPLGIITVKDLPKIVSALV